MANVTVRSVLWQTAAEAPEFSPDFSPDPVADVADFYAFVSPDRPDTVSGGAHQAACRSGGALLDRASRWTHPWFPKLCRSNPGRPAPTEVVAIVLRAIAGVIYPLVDPTFAPDPAASAVTDFTTYRFLSPERYQPSFPYLGKPYSAPLRSSPTPATYTGIARPENARPSSAHFGQKRPEPVQARR